jgi:hypothetical protein
MYVNVSTESIYKTDLIGRIMTTRAIDKHLPKHDIPQLILAVVRLP